jgi:hypothetical protein
VSLPVKLQLQKERGGSREDGGGELGSQLEEALAERGRTDARCVPQSSLFAALTRKSQVCVWRRSLPQALPDYGAIVWICGFVVWELGTGKGRSDRCNTQPM